MRLTRRELLRHALATSVLAGSVVAGGIGAGSLVRIFGQALAGSPRTELTVANPAGIRWGMVILARRFADPALAAQVIAACHTAHNVPDFSAPHTNPASSENPAHGASAGNSASSSSSASQSSPDRRIAWLRTLPFAQAFSDQSDTWLAAALRPIRFPLLCNHCDNPPCVRVCPSGACFCSTDGRVVQDPHRCIGCRYCMAACPYGARSFNFSDPKAHISRPNPNYPLRTQGVVEKCTLCPDRLAAGLPPHCVAASNGAMLVGNMLDPHSAPRVLLAAYTGQQRLPSLGTGPAVWYILDEVPAQFTNTVPTKIPGEIPVKITNDVPAKIPGDIPAQITNSMTDRTLTTISGDKPSPRQRT